MYSKPFRNAKYLSWIRQQYCVVTGMDFTQTDMVAHHVRHGHNGGMGIKPSDYCTIPLTAFQHAKLHQGVESEYYKLFELDIENLMRFHLQKYLLRQEVTMTVRMTFSELQELADSALKTIKKRGPRLA